MSKNGYTRRDFFGDLEHFDSNGKRIGTSRPGLFGGYDIMMHLVRKQDIVIRAFLAISIIRRNKDIFIINHERTLSLCV